jgi:hypothetical protein
VALDTAVTWSIPHYRYVQFEFNNIHILYLKTVVNSPGLKCVCETGYKTYFISNLPHYLSLLDNYSHHEGRAKSMTVLVHSFQIFTAALINLT